MYLIGLVIALALPILATMLVMSTNQQPITLNGIVQSQFSNPILWLVNITSIIFIVLMLAGMLREQNHAQHVVDLQEIISLRIADLYSLKEIYHNEIQERQLAEINISRAKREWETTFDAIPDLILLTDSQGKIIRCNEATIQKLESSYSEILGKPIEKVFPGVVEPIQKRVINKTQVIPMPSKYGWFEVTGFQFQFFDDQPGMIYIFHDIAQRKSSEVELQRQKQYFEAIFQNSPVAIVTLDLNNRIVTSNPAFEYLFGYSPVEAAGRKLDDLVLPPEYRDKAYEYTRRIRRTDVRHEVNQRLTKQGVTVDVEVFTVPVVVKGETLGTLVLFYNITDLVQARRKAEDADLAKSAYLANISHEIRTPLNGLIGLLSMTLDTTLSPRQTEYLSTAADQAEELLSLLNEILDLSKIEAGRMQLESTPFDLRLVMENVALTMAQRANEKEIELICIVPPSVPTKLRGDPNRLRQVLSNLTANAVKFTDDGEVVLSAQLVADNGADASLTFSVQDTGIGIPLDRQAAIFERFTQADQSTQSKYGGSGLGLSISAQIVELMGSKISLVSEPGIGSIFTFTVSFDKHGENDPPSTALVEYTRGLKVLVVDENSNNRLNLQLLMNELESNTSFAAGAAEALALIEQAEAAGEQFQLMVVDNKLADELENSFKDALHQIVADHPIKIIISTRMGDVVDEAIFEALGIGGVVLKPIRRQPLHNVLYDLLSTEKKSVDKPSASRFVDRAGDLKTSKPQQILLAEDNPINRKVIVHLLEKFGHTVRTVENGRQAIEALKNNGYNLVLMDVQMPDLDGHEAVTRIRFVEGKDHHTPVLALTGHTTDHEIQRCFSSGMDACISKPVRPQELFDAVEKWAIPIPLDRPWLDRAVGLTDALPDFTATDDSVENGLITDLEFAEFSSAFDQLVLSSDSAHPTGQPAERLTGRTAKREKLTVQTRKEHGRTTFGSSDYLQNILPRFGNDLPFFIKTFEEFFIECRSTLAEIRQAVHLKDAPAIHLLAHNFKSVTANFEVENLETLASEMEIQTAGGDLSQVLKLAASMERNFPALEAYLDEIRTLQ